MSYCYRILHIADPHFSNCHFTGTPADIGLRQAQEVKKALGQWTALAPFDFLVLSGDFTFRCDPAGFQAAEVFIDTLMRYQAGAHEPLIRRDGLIVIPGNHDVDLSTPVVIKNSLSLPTSKKESEAQFRAFLARIEKYVGRPNDRLSMVARFSRTNHRGLVIMALNSCRSERRDAQGWGYVGTDQIHEAASKLLNDPSYESRAQQGDVVLAVIHHNLLPIWDLGLDTLGHVPDDRKFSFVMDAGGTLNFFADLGVRVILHGHTHVESVKSVDGYASDHRLRPHDKNDPDLSPILILGCGSLGVHYSGGEPTIPPHHFQVIEIEPEDELGLFLVRSQEFRCLFRGQDTDREWTSEKGVEELISTTWDTEKVKALLNTNQRLFTSNAAAYASEVMDSWSALRVHELESARWPRVLNDLYERVRKIYGSAQRNQFESIINSIFSAPPPEHIICEQTLEEYVKRRLTELPS